MRRLVVAFTALLVMVGAAVVVGYLLLFSAVADRAARATPADAAVYLNVYLQPSSGQKMNLLGLVGRLRGFRDVATVEDKIHEVAQRLFGEAGIDYATNVRPWLGAQVALAATPPGAVGSTPHLLLLAAVRDSVAARAAVPRLLARTGVTYAPEAYRGQRAMMSAGTSYALLDDLLVVADTPDRLRAALDANADAAPSLADSAAYAAAMRTVPADHLASVYLNLGRLAPSDADGRLGGYATAALALTAEPNGLHLDGSAPFAAHAASVAARAAFALGSQRASLTAWMPRSIGAELLVFGLQQSLVDLEAEMAADPSFAQASDALNQLRSIAAIGLGINVDRDLLPLFDGEAALALRSLDSAGPHGQLLLRPSDPVAAQAALDRMRDGLAERGSSVSTSQAAGAMVTSVTIPEIGRVAYARVDGVVLLALDPADVAAALEAHAGGDTLAADDRYTAAFKLVGTHAGNEIWSDIPGLVDAAASIFDPGRELRDILHQIGELAMSASTNADQLEIHAVLTVK
jgi:hypothetical protein